MRLCGKVAVWQCTGSEQGRKVGHLPVVHPRGRLVAQVALPYGVRPAVEAAAARDRSRRHPASCRGGGGGGVGGLNAERRSRHGPGHLGTVGRGRRGAGMGDGAQRGRALEGEGVRPPGGVARLGGEVGGREGDVPGRRRARTPHLVARLRAPACHLQRDRRARGRRTHGGEGGGLLCVFFFVMGEKLRDRVAVLVGGEIWMRETKRGSWQPAGEKGWETGAGRRAKANRFSSTPSQHGSWPITGMAVDLAATVSHTHEWQHYQGMEVSSTHILSRHDKTAGRRKNVSSQIWKIDRLSAQQPESPGGLHASTKCLISRSITCVPFLGSVKTGLQSAVYGRSILCGAIYLSSNYLITGELGSSKRV